MKCAACGQDCASAYAVWMGRRYHPYCIPNKSLARSMGGTPPTPPPKKPPRRPNDKR
jgi:hypothetical protein